MILADPAAALAEIETNGDPARRFALAFQRGSVSVGMYAPRGQDFQTPHAQDELYVVYRGTGEFLLGADRRRFAAGSVLFAPAGAPHRFENFSEDFATWVLFFGPEGGEHVEATQ
jgi:mannose-6-phosphate isomerase-like protein (cupin superfamily)